MDPRERDLAHLQEMAVHIGELIQQIRLDTKKVEKIIELNALAAAQGWPTYLSSPPMLAEEEK